MTIRPHSKGSCNISLILSITYFAVDRFFNGHLDARHVGILGECISTFRAYYFIGWQSHLLVQQEVYAGRIIRHGRD